MYLCFKIILPVLRVFITRRVASIILLINLAIKRCMVADSVNSKFNDETDSLMLTC